MADTKISAGQTSTGLTLSAGDRLFISSGGTANNTTLNAASAFVSAGGRLNTTILNGGVISVFGSTDWS